MSNNSRSTRFGKIFSLRLIFAAEYSQEIEFFFERGLRLDCNTSWNKEVVSLKVIDIAILVS